MRRALLAATLTAAASVGFLTAAPRAQAAAPLGGVWTLNRAASEFPAELGFNPAWATNPPADGGGSAGGSGGGGRGGRRGGGSGGGGGNRTSPFSPRAESYEDARKIQLVTSNARNPPSRLMIVDTPAAVTITNELGQSRTIHPDGREETIEIEGTLFGVTSKRDGGELTVTYRVGTDREIRYIYSSTADPKRLIVDVQFLQKGNSDKARRIYEAGTDTVTSAAAGAAPAKPGDAPTGSAPAGGKAGEAFDQRPGAELRGLTNIGVLVENLSGQATACGLNQDTLEGSLAKKLGDAGFVVKRNSDEDTYVYVNVMTSSVANGVCVSRYDAFLYTQGTARVSYHDQPVLVQISLIHRGGIGSSVPSSHPAVVTRGLEGFIDVFVTQIRNANK